MDCCDLSNVLEDKQCQVWGGKRLRALVDRRWHVWGNSVGRSAGLTEKLGDVVANDQRTMHDDDDVDDGRNANEGAYNINNGDGDVYVDDARLCLARRCGHVFGARGFIACASWSLFRCAISV